MKGKVLSFIIGILVGAIIATAGWFIYAKVKSNSNSGNQMEQMQKPDGMSGENMQGNMSEPPTKPDGDNNLTEPPAKPDESSTSEMKQSMSNNMTENN